MTEPTDSPQEDRHRIVEAAVDAMFRRELCDMMFPAVEWPRIIARQRQEKTQEYLAKQWDADTVVVHLAELGLLRITPPPGSTG